MKQLPCLQDFLPVELCNLDYHPERGSAIDPHFDDFWVWGERLVTLNLLSDTYLTFTNDDVPSVEVAVPLIRRSLIVVYGPARKEWKHSIKRGDIKERRLATTLRELTPEFLEGGPNESAGKNLLDVALSFSGVAVGVSWKLLALGCIYLNYLFILMVQCRWMKLQCLSCSIPSTQVWNHWLYDKVWYLQHNCVGDTIVYHEASKIICLCRDSLNIYFISIYQVGLRIQPFCWIKCEYFWRTV